MTQSGDVVGPVLEAGETAQAVIVAIRKSNAVVDILDRGAYLRVLVPERCLLERVEVERVLGRPFHLPRDLELVMPSFQGRLRVTPDRAVWEAGR